jgi:hypothetical protein
MFRENPYTTSVLGSARNSFLKKAISFDPGKHFYRCLVAQQLERKRAEKYGHILARFYRQRIPVVIEV